VIIEMEPEPEPEVGGPEEQLATSSMADQVMKIEALKAVAFERDDFEECARLRALQMQLLGQPEEEAAPGAGANVEELDGVLATQMHSALGELDELRQLREELEHDLAGADFAAAELASGGRGGKKARTAAAGGGGGSAAEARAETMRAVAELEELKLKLMDGKSLAECGIEDEAEAAVGGWAAPAPAAKPERSSIPQGSLAIAGGEAAPAATDTVAMMAEMEALNAEMDAELASLSRAVGAAKAQSSQLSGMKDALLQEFEDTRREVFRQEGVVDAKSF